MITASDVLRQLIRRLPRQTDSFCKELTYTDLEIKGGHLTFKTNEPFDLPYIVSSGIAMLNPLEQVTVSGATTLLRTKNAHKFSVNQKQILIETDVGGFELQRVVDSTIIAVIGNAHGATVIKEDLKSSVVLMKVKSSTDDVVTVEIGEEYTYDCICEGRLFSSKLNITIAPTVSKMITHYSSQLKDTSKLWMYIVFGDRRTISKPEADAGIISNAMATQYEVIKVTTEFDIFVWFPTNTKNENARAQIDMAYGSLYDVINKCLFGHISDTTGKGGYHCVPHSSGTSEAEGIPNYVHTYKYLHVEEISYMEDGQDPAVDYFDESISELDFNLLIKSGDEEPQSMKIKLDKLRG